MKFGKLSVLITLLFSAFIVIFVYTACERNVCNNVTCFNGGSCNAGVCNCPIGYEGPQCQTKSVTRYLGNYAGLTTCNNQPQIFDTAQVSLDNLGILNVSVALRSLLPKVLLGSVSSSAATYAINISNNDSSYNAADSTYYSRVYTVTLQNDKTLTINFYEKHLSPTDTTIEKCTFIGTKE